MWPAVSLVKRRSAGQSCFAEEVGGVLAHAEIDCTGSFLPWTIASGTDRWAARRASSL